MYYREYIHEWDENEIVPIVFLLAMSMLIPNNKYCTFYR